ncbi:hypothetical protein NLC27_03780, partial [Candidatus Aminicenantes bacterium AC-708-I09]|nr:hypothetical protein [Candidatus Aminicenantes bacterium AC-708-I09]
MRKKKILIIGSGILSLILILLFIQFLKIKNQNKSLENQQDPPKAHKNNIIFLTEEQIKSAGISTSSVKRQT